MLLHWGAEYLGRILPLHLQARMKEPRCNPYLDTVTGIPPVPYVDAYTGQVLADVPMEGINRISRTKLRRFLTQGENLNIQVCVCVCVCVGSFSAHYFERKEGNRGD